MDEGRREGSAFEGAEAGQRTDSLGIMQFGLVIIAKSVTRKGTPILEI